MIERKIRNTYIEIVFIIIFIIISIPLWKYLNQKLNVSLAETIKAETNLELVLNNKDGYDNVIVNNAYQIPKKYQVLLIADKDCNNELITINGINYQLKDFLAKEENGNYAYVLATNTVKGSRNGYKIDTNLSNKNIKYYYELEELADF